MLLEDQKRILKDKRIDALAKLRKWKEALAKQPENTEAKKRVEVYEKISNDLKFRVKYINPRKKPVEFKKKWSPVLSGSFESGKRR